MTARQRLFLFWLACTAATSSEGLQLPLQNNNAKRVASFFDNSLGFLEQRRAVVRKYRNHENEAEEVVTTMRDLRSRGDDAALSSSSSSSSHQNNRLLRPPPTVAIRDMSAYLRNEVLGVGAIDTSLVQSICMNQITALGLLTVLAVVSQWATSGSVDLNSVRWTTDSAPFLFDTNLTPLRVAEGVLTVLPAIALSQAVQTSDRRDASHAHFSTTNMVLKLFGPRKRQRSTTAAVALTTTKTTTSTPPPPPNMTSTFQVIGFTALMAGVAALSEEIVFRAYIPAAILYCTHSLPCALWGQTLLFGMGHWYTTKSSGEQRVMSAMHTANGLWFGMVYLMTGGDILPCILGHALYDGHVYVEAWKRINDQMEWTERAQRPPPDEEAELGNIQSVCEGGVTDETLSFCRRFFYGFDYERKESLSLSDTQRAVSYAFLQDSDVPAETKVKEMFDAVIQRRRRSSTLLLDDDDDEQRLSLSEFLRVLFALKTSRWAPKLTT